MVRAARRLPPLPVPSSDAPEVCILTGRRFWYQTAFCFWSLRRHASQPIRAVFFDDGTFDQALRAECIRIFPGSRVEEGGEIETRPDKRWADALGVKRQVDVPVLRLDNFRSEQAAAFPDLIKCNIQGTELDALRGGIEVLARASWLLIEVQFIPAYAQACHPAEIDSFLWEKGFELIGMERDTEPWEELN
jgi:hypothetical protein